MNETPNRLTDASVRSVTRSLREFGYSELTEQEVRETSDRLLAGGAPDGDVIAMFIARMMREAGLLPDEA